MTETKLSASGPTDSASKGQAAPEPQACPQAGHNRRQVQGYRSTLVSDTNFEWLRLLQRRCGDEPRLDLKYIVDGALTLLQRSMPAGDLEAQIQFLAREALRSHLKTLNDASLPNH